MTDLCDEEISSQTPPASSKLTPQKRQKSPLQTAVEQNSGGENDHLKKRNVRNKAPAAEFEPPAAVAESSSAFSAPPRRKAAKASSSFALPSIDESSEMGPFSSSMGSEHVDLNITAPVVSKVLNSTLSASLMRLKGRQRGGGSGSATVAFTAEVTTGAHSGVNLLLYPSENDLIIGSSKNSFLCLENDDEVIAEHVSIKVDAAEGLTLHALGKNVSLRGYTCRMNRYYYSFLLLLLVLLSVL